MLFKALKGRCEEERSAATYRYDFIAYSEYEYRKHTEAAETQTGRCEKWIAQGPHKFPTTPP